MFGFQRENIKLFWVSFVMLFLEIILIRWISTETRIFAYLNNLVLLSCFLGIGLGCYFSREKALHEIYKTGVEATTLYDKPIHLIYEGDNFDVDPFPNATYLSRRLILIPTHPLIGIKNLKKVVDAIGRGLR